jgi:hypothetical protein
MEFYATAPKMGGKIRGPDRVDWPAKGGNSVQPLPMAAGRAGKPLGFGVWAGSFSLSRPCRVQLNLSGSADTFYDGGLALCKLRVSSLTY